MSKRSRLSWRQPQEDQLRQEAFLADIATHWQPTTRREHSLQLRALAVHLFARLFDGPPSLAPGVLAGGLAALGTVLLPLAPAPTNPAYVLGPPSWAYLLVTVGLIGLSVETARSPRRIRPLRYALLVALPVAIGASVIGAMLHIATPADEALRIGVPGFGVSVIVLVICAARQRFSALRVVLRLSAVALAVTAVSQFAWAWTYGASGYAVLAIGSACVAGGAALNALGFARADLAPTA